MYVYDSLLNIRHCTLILDYANFRVCFLFVSTISLYRHEKHTGGAAVAKGASSPRRDYKRKSLTVLMR